MSSPDSSLQSNEVSPTPPLQSIGSPAISCPDGAASRKRRPATTGPDKSCKPRRKKKSKKKTRKTKKQRGRHSSKRSPDATGCSEETQSKGSDPACPADPKVKDQKRDQQHYSGFPRTDAG